MSITVPDKNGEPCEYPSVREYLVDWQIVVFARKPDGTFEAGECRDDHFAVPLTKEHLLLLADELRALAEAQKAAQSFVMRDNGLDVPASATDVERDAHGVRFTMPPQPRPMTVEPFYSRRDMKWRVRITGANGEKVMVSEAYAREQGARRAARRMVEAGSQGFVLKAG